MMKLVSVIVLNFNGKKIIGKCLDHLLMQTYPEFEIIVVDNHSTDGSTAILEQYLSSGKVSVVKSNKNLGVPGGRNLGLLYAKGTVVAFMDNDGYATPTWLEEVVRTFEKDEQIGAVAAVVFFNKKKTILNGAGATMNLQGYGSDICFNVPYEFARVPSKVLYPMGCGMAIRKSVMDKIGPLDTLLFNYYDDTELGIRVWSSGFQVVVAPNAWVDHDFSFSDQLLKNKVYLCERNRIRTVLKYYPLGKIIRWLFQEWRLLRYLRSASLWNIPFRAWIWNAFHLPSAVKWRLRFSFKTAPLWHLVYPSWGVFPPRAPNNQSHQLDLRHCSDRLLVNGLSDVYQLNFGWYHSEKDGHISYRWTERIASALFQFRSAVSSLSIRFRVPLVSHQVMIVARRLGSRESTWEVLIHTPSVSWEEKTYPCSLGEGVYEVLLLTRGIFIDCSGRRLGVGVSYIQFH